VNEKDENVLPMELVRRAVAKMKGPYDYQETRKVADQLAKKTAEDFEELEKENKQKPPK